MRSSSPLLAALAVLAMSSPATAQVAPTGDPQRYQAAIQNALAEFESGHYEEARAFFRQAHREIPNPRTLRGIGMASYELRDYVEAYRALTGALQFGPSDRDLTAEHREAATALLARTRGLLAIVTQVPPFAEVRLDGAEHATEADGTVLVPLGSHRLDVTLPDGRHGQQIVEVSGGETIPWTAELAAAQPLMTPVPVEEEEAPPPIEPEPAPVAPSDGRPLPRFRLNVMGFVGAGSYESLDAVYRTTSAYYGAVTGGGAVSGLLQVAEVFAVGLQLAGSYASLFEANSFSDTSYWAQTDVLAWGELRFGMLAVGVGVGAAIGFREASVFEGGWRYVETRTDAGLGLVGDVRVYFLDDLLFVAAEGRFSFLDYGGLAGVVAFGVEPLR